jgi:hypothetical protein
VCWSKSLLVEVLIDVLAWFGIGVSWSL